MPLCTPNPSLPEEFHPSQSQLSTPGNHGALTPSQWHVLMLVAKKALPMTKGAKGSGHGQDYCFIYLLYFFNINPLFHIVSFKFYVPVGGHHELKPNKLMNTYVYLDLYFFP